MISEDEIIRRIRISDLGSSNKAYENEMIRKYKIAAKTRLQYPTLTQKWTIDNQRQELDVNDRTKIIAGRGSPFFDKIEFMIKTESELEQFLGSVYPTTQRQSRSRKTFWERIDTRIKGNPKFSKYNMMIEKEKTTKIIPQQKSSITIPETKISDKVVIPETVIPKKTVSISTALIPIAILTFLLINSSESKS